MTLFKPSRAMHSMRQNNACCAEPKRFAMNEPGEPGFRGRGHGGGHGRGAGHGLGQGLGQGRGQGGGQGRGGPGGRLRRLLEHGDLRLLVLHLIADRPRHGYEIIKAIEELAGGAYTPSPGVVYPTLTLLEEIGHVSSIAEGNRKSFTITPDGTAALAADRASLDAILARIAQVQAQIRAEEPALPVVRAMENLRTALRLKLASDTTPPELARKIADAIDHTARIVEDL